MKNIKHSKFKNTGILFELLVRQIAVDTMNNQKSKSVNLIKKHFNSKSELTKELNLYKALSEEKFKTENLADKFITISSEARKKLNESVLRRRKYNLIKDIKSTFLLEEFFKSRIPNYKVFASIYKLFEYSSIDNPASLMKSKQTLIEHVTATKNKQKPLVSETYSKQEKDIRLLSYKILIDRFNDKYNTLNENQKSILREYINNVSNSITLQEYIQSKIPEIQNNITKLTSGVSSRVIKIKLKQVTKMLNELKDVRFIKDKHILTMLKYYELIKELKIVKG